MSARALLLAVQNRLRSAAVLNDAAGSVVKVRATGRPWPGCGQWAYSVWFGGLSQRPDQGVVDYADADYAVVVTVTGRMGYSPDDRQGDRLTAAEQLAARVDVLCTPGVIHGNYAEVMNEANELIPGTAEYAAVNGGGVTVNGFVEPLWLLGASGVVERPGSWVGSKEASDVVSVDVRFGRARRLVLG